MFYLGAPAFFGQNGKRDSELARVPGYQSGYYKLGLAVANNPLGPFKRLKGDGTKDWASAGDKPILEWNDESIKNWNVGWHKGNSGTAMGSLMKIDGIYYYFYTSSAPSNKDFGIGYATAPDIYGPWTMQTKAVLPPEYQIENGSLVFNTNNNYYYFFGNAVTKPPHDNSDRWKNYWNKCGNEGSMSTLVGSGLAMLWSNNPLEWNIDNKLILASSMGNKYVWEGVEKSSSPQKCNGDITISPDNINQHRGNVGLGTGLYDPKENSIYVYFDGTDMNNHLYRDIFLTKLTFERVEPTPAATQPAQNPKPKLIKENIPSVTPKPTIIATPKITPTAAKLFCGDKKCNNKETCSTCPTDCGKCSIIKSIPNLFKTK